VPISDRAASAVLRGHPWIYRDQIEGAVRLRSGEILRAVHRGRIVGAGMWNASSPIAIRVWTDGADLDPILPKRVEHALSQRDRTFHDGKTTAYRAIHGEGDRMPGFVVDRYGSVAILRTDGDGAEARVDWFVRELWPRLVARGITSLAHRDHQTGVLRPLAGQAPAEIVDVLEHGIPMRVDLARGQKTGAFLDQRENRRRVATLARGRRVLNLFSYAGGFALSAALGGAAHTTSVDIAAHAHKSAQASFELAGIDPKGHAFVTADVFAFLDQAAKRKETWDLVVSDPPSFAPSEAAKVRALGAYRRLHRACAAVLAQDGILCAASCSSHITERDFLTTLDDASIGRADLCVRELHGPPSDHPHLAAWPEGRYLKFAVLS
jgi:23S rRNA (cytosine1962-C5)-methyltransferase